MSGVGDWLLQGPAWVQYRTRGDLLAQPEDRQGVLAARQAMLGDAQVRGLLAELATWPGSALKRHNDAGHALHKLVFVADLGLRAGDPGMGAIVERVLEHQSPEGPFQVLMNIAQHYGGSGQDEQVWALCDVPLILYALVRLGLQDDARVQAAAQHLAALLRDNGWPCAVSPKLGKFRGPGRKDDPCPYATLVMLQALAQLPAWRDSATCRTGAEALLGLWQQRKERKPYLFAMGTDFAKLKVPLVWYDVLHVLDVLTHFAWLRSDARLHEMAGIVRFKADAEGRFTPESIWTAWKGWEFGQKREPSRWLTLIARRALARLE